MLYWHWGENGDVLEIRISYVPLPESVHGLCSLEDPDGYIILINSGDDPCRQAAALQHELNHIRNHDHDKKNVTEIENHAREEERV